MRRLNLFQKDLCILVGLFIAHTLVTFLFPLRSVGTIDTVTVEHGYYFLSFETGEGEVFTYYPVLVVLYIAVLLFLLIRRRESLTLIYGLGLVLLTKFTFYTQLSQLEGAQENMRIEGVLSKTISVDGAPAVQDVSIYVLLLLVFIKAVIVIYQYFRKHSGTKRIYKNEATY